MKSRDSSVDRRPASSSQKEQFEGEDWKVTISSEHQLETIADTPRTTVVVTPKPPKKGEEIKQEQNVRKDMGKVVTKGKVEKKVYKDPRHDPIPKPPMHPAARPLGVMYP